MSKYIIALDAMGGDNAPQSVVNGSILALKEFDDIEIILTGPEERLQSMLESAGSVKDRITILPADDVIEMDESPMMAVRKKRNASMVVAANAVREGRAGACVSAGSTGAVLACGMFKLGRIPGIERPALAPILPTIDSSFLLIDAGANVDCQPKFLQQFGLMGSVYMKSVMGIDEPRVGLVNIGAEAEKGNKLTKESYELMTNQTSYKFVGNAEARDLFTGNFDVVVADGFAGNIILKQTEGLSKALFSMIKQGLMSSLTSKIGALLIKPSLSGLKSKMDYNKIGGAPLLGVNGAMVKAHGSSGDEAIKSAISQARKMLVGDVVGKIQSGLEGLDNTGNQDTDK